MWSVLWYSLLNLREELKKMAIRQIIPPYQLNFWAKIATDRNGACAFCPEA